MAHSIFVLHTSVILWYWWFSIFKF